MVEKDQSNFTVTFKGICRSLIKFDFDVLNIMTGETLQLLAIMTGALLRFHYGGTRTRQRRLRNSPSSNRCYICYNS